MIATVTTYIEEVLVPMGAIGVFFASIIEEVIVPIPAALVQMSAGATLSGLFSEPSLSFGMTLFFQVIVPVSLGVTLGSLVIYAIGYCAGKPVLERWGEYFGLAWRDVDQRYRKLRHVQADATMLFFLRVTPIVPSVAISAVCGVVRMKVWRYFFLSLLGNVVRATFIVMIGWSAGELYRNHSAVVDQFERYVLWGGVITLLLYILLMLVYGRFRSVRSED